MKLVIEIVRKAGLDEFVHTLGVLPPDHVTGDKDHISRRINRYNGGVTIYHFESNVDIFSAALPKIRVAAPPLDPKITRTVVFFPTGSVRTSSAKSL